MRETKDFDTIPEEFKESPEVIKAVQLAEESAYTPEELDAYDEYLDAIRVEGTIRQDSFEDGQQIGIAKGEEKVIEEKKQIARKLLAKGMSRQEVSDLTGLLLTEFEA